MSQQPLQQLQIRKFNMKDVPQHGVLLVQGRRGLGKSFCIRDYLAHNPMPVGMVICPTEECNRWYQQFVPKIFIHYQYSSDLIHNLIRRQKLIIKKMRREIKANGKSDIDPRAFLVLDDCLASASTLNKDCALRYLFFNGRHLYIAMALGFQYPLALQPALRGQVDVCCMLSEPNIGNKRRLWENFGGCLSFDAFGQVLDACTNNREMLVIHNSSLSNTVTDRLYWYRASAHDTLKIGLPEYWQMSKELPNSDDDEDDEGLPPYDPAAFNKRRTTPTLTVRKGL
jgi:hypothetical protein